MLEVDFSRIFKDVTMKSAPVAQAPKRRSGIKNPQIGNMNRIQHLPDEVNAEFIEQYKDTLDRFVQPYVAHGQVTVSYASKYAQAILDNIFGTERHLGIFHYLKNKGIEELTDKELVNHAEKYLLKGWHIRLEGSKYWLYNEDLTKIIDMTGSNDVSLLSEAQTIDNTNTHLFFEESVAAKINAFADRLGYDADALSSTNGLSVLLPQTENREFYGYLTNYERLQIILSKYYKYRTLTGGLNVHELYDEGYRISSTLVPKGAMLSNGTSELLIYPTTDEMNIVYNVNKSLLGHAANILRKNLYKSLSRVKFQDSKALKDMQHVYAFVSKFWDTDLVRNSYVETKDAVRRLEHHAQNNLISRGYKNSLEQALACVIVTECILLGNKNFTYSSFGLDTLSGNVYVYSTFDAFTRESVNNFEETSDVFSFRESARDYISDVPKAYLKVLKTLEFPDEEFVQTLPNVKSYFEEARTFILREAE